MKSLPLCSLAEPRCSPLLSGFSSAPGWGFAVESGSCTSRMGSLGTQWCFTSLGSNQMERGPRWAVCGKSVSRTGSEPSLEGAGLSQDWMTQSLWPLAPFQLLPSAQVSALPAASAAVRRPCLVWGHLSTSFPISPLPSPTLSTFSTLRNHWFLKRAQFFTGCFPYIT